MFDYWKPQFKFCPFYTTRENQRYTFMKMYEFKITFICVLFSFSMGWSQIPSSNDARKLFDETVNYLKRSDTSAFIKQWAQYAEPGTNPLTSADLLNHFDEMRNFLDTALKRNMPIEEIEVESMCDDEQRPVQTERCNYYIKIWFKYLEYYRKGVGLEIKYFTSHWMYIGSPDYTTQISR